MGYCLLVDMRAKRDSSYGCFKALLLLGRVSNLPTIWSNCLASWLLAGGTLVEAADVKRFTCLIGGATQGLGFTGLIGKKGRKAPGALD